MFSKTVLEAGEAARCGGSVMTHCNTNIVQRLNVYRIASSCIQSFSDFKVGLEVGYACDSLVLSGCNSATKPFDSI